MINRFPLHFHHTEFKMQAETKSPTADVKLVLESYESCKIVFLFLTCRSVGHQHFLPSTQPSEMSEDRRTGNRTSIIWTTWCSKSIQLHQSLLLLDQILWTMFDCCKMADIPSLITDGRTSGESSGRDEPSQSVSSDRSPLPSVPLPFSGEPVS